MEKLINSKDARQMLGSISTVTLWRLVRDGFLPRPIKLGNGNTNYYKLSWIQELIGGTRNDAA